MREGLGYHGNHLWSLSRTTIEPLSHWLSEKTGHQFATASSYAEGAVNYLSSYETPRRRPRSIKRRAVR